MTASAANSFGKLPLPASVERHARPPEQRISGALQRPDHRPDATALYQPPLASRLPDGANTAEDVRQLSRAPNGYLIAERAKLDWANMIWNVDRPLCHALILRCASVRHKRRCARPCPTLPSGRSRRSRVFVILPRAAKQVPG
jgi:hypothetical protein